MNKSTRALDSAQELIINEFVKRYLFDKTSVISQLIYSKDIQIKGVDMLADGIKYDFKAQSSPRYINKPTDTFIVELSFLDKYDERVDGWFIKEDLLTDRYAFIWITDAKVNEQGYITNINDINSIEVMIVDKHNLQTNFFNTIGNKDCVDIENELLDIEERNPDRKPFKYINNIKFVLSNQLYERPIVAVLTKDFLKQSAISHYEVTKNSLKNL